MIKAHKDQLIKIATALMEEETLTGEQIQKLVEPEAVNTPAIA